MAVQHETGKDMDIVRAEKGELRQIVMDLLYRVGGQGPEIGRLFGIDYGPVSQERSDCEMKLSKET